MTHIFFFQVVQSFSWPEIHSSATANLSGCEASTTSPWGTPTLAWPTSMTSAAVSTTRQSFTWRHSAQKSSSASIRLIASRCACAASSTPATAACSARKDALASTTGPGRQTSSSAAQSRTPTFPSSSRWTPLKSGSTATTWVTSIPRASLAARGWPHSTWTIASWPRSARRPSAASLSFRFFVLRTTSWKKLKATSFQPWLASASFISTATTSSASRSQPLTASLPWLCSDLTEISWPPSPSGTWPTTHSWSLSTWPKTFGLASVTLLGPSPSSWTCRERGLLIDRTLSASPTILSTICPTTSCATTPKLH